MKKHILLWLDDLRNPVLRIPGEDYTWLEKYAHITDNRLQITDDSLSVDVVKDSVEKKDFVEPMRAYIRLFVLNTHFSMFLDVLIETNGR